MRRAAAVILCLGLAGPALATRAAPQIELKVATTGSKIKAFGEASPRRPERKVRLTLTVGDTKARKNVRVRNDGTYIASFARPDSGTCEVTATYIGASHTIGLPCARPEWSTSSAQLFGDETTEIAVEIADSSAERAYGLMYRKTLPTGQGMVFEWGAEHSGGFWMMNTLLPLSIAFYDEAGIIVDILDMDPCYDPPNGDCPTYEPDSSYWGALEVNQGAFEGWGIGEGDIIVVE